MEASLTDRLKKIFSRFIHLWLALAVGVLVIAFSFFDFYELIELKMYDQRMVMRNLIFGQPEQIPNLATLDVDDRSVATIGRFEDWPRTYHARVIDIVGALGAKGVGIDFLLLEESTPMVREDDVITSDAKTREDLLALFENPDHILANTNARWNNVYYAQFLAESEDQDYEAFQARRGAVSEEQQRIIDMQNAWSVPISEAHHRNFFIGTELWAPVDTILKTARGVGQVQPIPDKDGIVRRNRAFYLYEDRLYPTLSLVMACDYLGVPIENMQVERNRIVLPNAWVPGEDYSRDVIIPITERGEIFINWVGDFRSTFRHYPYAAVTAFWETYQRDRLAASVKQVLSANPDVLFSILNGEVDLNQFTIDLLLYRAGFPTVDMIEAIQDVGAAMRLAPYAYEGMPFADAVQRVFGKSPSQLSDQLRWLRIYSDVQMNHRIAALIGQQPSITVDQVASELGVQREAVSRRIAQLRLIANPTDGRITPQQYPLWFFSRTREGNPVASREMLNTQLATAMKQYFRTHSNALSEVIGTIDSDDPMAYEYLGSLALTLIAEASNFPKQEYGFVVEEIVQAALLEPFIAEGMNFDELIFSTFGVEATDVPEEILAPYYDVYTDLSRNLTIERLVTTYPGISIGEAADSVSAIAMAELRLSAPDMSAEELHEFGTVRPVDIASDFYTLQHIVATEGTIPAEAHPLVFYTIIVDGEPVFPSDFRDAVFFYGITSTGGHDRNPMPFEPRYPMVGMHANLFNQIITGQFLHQPDAWVNWLIIIALALLMGLAVPRFAPSWGAVIMVGILAGFLVAGLLLFVKNGLWIDMVGPIIVVTASYLGITVRNYIVEEREKKFIKGAFANYLAPEVVDQIAENPEQLKLGGENFDITAFFSDVQGFSTISQALTATQLVELLNVYLTEMCDIIIEHQGTVDKFEGDAIIAFFGAPIAYSDHAVRACLATIAMQERLDILRPQFKETSGHDLFQRIGLNSGNCVVGNMGSRNRFDYTMMGDNVNLAARLESSAKQYAIYTQISDSTYQGAKNDVEARELDRTIVVGRSEPVTVYELLSRKGELDPVRTKMRDLYHEGLAYYREQKWEQAIEKFNAAIAAVPDKGDPTSKIMIGRCESILSGEVQIATDWNGAWALTSK